ncbi:hypothetical protein, partial [Mesorhizobium japonicum]|uniref:hypothetical protein n=1 Tax=Mesorhizobium japonicum TaxID=2066070 RepID=UPI003B58C3CA
MTRDADAIVFISPVAGAPMWRVTIEHSALSSGRVDKRSEKSRAAVSSFGVDIGSPLTARTYSDG